MCGCDGQSVMPVQGQASFDTATITYTSAPYSGKIGPCQAPVDAGGD
jgi:hypothetical protein